MKALSIRILLVAGTILCGALFFGCAGPGGSAARTRSAPEDRAAWMREARLGVMIHYLADWRARADGGTMSIERWNQLVNSFDVERLADQLKAMDAGYLIFTIGQNSGYFAAPNATYDRLVAIEPGKCSQRDLVMDLSRALHKRGIRLIVYLPSGAPAGDRAARTALQWENGPHANREFQRKWELIIADWSRRWGANVAGWWFDGCYWPNMMYRSKDHPNFESFAAAARAGNPKSAVAFNPGVVPRLISMTPYEDYTAGEISDPALLTIRRTVDGRLDGKQVHVLSYLGRTWGMGEPRFPAEQVIAWSTEVCSLGGAITWDVPAQPNGLIPPAFVDQLTAIGKALPAR